MENQEAQFTFTIVQRVHEVTVGGSSEDQLQAPRCVVATAQNMLGPSTQSDIGRHVDGFNAIHAILRVLFYKSNSAAAVGTITEKGRYRLVVVILRLQAVYGIAAP